MPQLSQIPEIYASQLFWLAIVFALIYFGIGKAMVPKIERTVEDRNARIAGDLAAAEAARDAAQASDAAYESGLEAARTTALATLSQAKDKATAKAEAEVKKGDAASEAKIAEATVRIEATKTEALGEIEAETVDAVQAIVTKLSGVTADRVSVTKQVKAALANG
ncbi:ATPase [Sphingomonas sp. NPDC092331]|jgi:F-type H+-transporting ATPase subunit b|uniref:F0F1 ATP synthase subunit B family protein n=1 Tax=unclassified Sphingomonas TaxID=196159 RepID=UPI0029F3F66C|nr:ATPase [Pseudomonadota bacterium]